MTSYIYLNEYEGGFLYVGSHVWSGPTNILDPFYHGSSVVAQRTGLKLISERILEVILYPRTREGAEKEWIERFAIQYGIADCALGCSEFSDWVYKFSQHGRVINLHS